MLAPGNPNHATQVIDQRDLTEWIVRLAENGTMGDFNATGPTTVRLLPPLLIDEAQADDAIARLRAVLTDGAG